MTHDHVAGEVVITATEFKAKCLELFDQLQRRAIRKVTVTKRGKATAVVLQPDPVEDFDARSLVGSMKGMVEAPAGYDWTAPVVTEPLDAKQGVLHR